MTTARTAPHRLLAVLLAAALAFIALPVTAAMAAPAGTASLTTPASLFPTKSAPFTFSVTNGGAALVGENISWVRFTLPEEAGIVHNDTSFTPPSNWTASREGEAGEVQSVTFRASSAAAAIRPGASMSFTFPAAVQRPDNAERSGTFTVAASNDSGRTTTGIVGNLTTTVKILDIVRTGAAGAGVVAPELAADGNGTAGQDVTYAYSVINYAKQDVPLTTTLVSSDAGDVITDATRTVTAPGAGTREIGSEVPQRFTYSVKLGAATAGDRDSVFTATATSGASKAADAVTTYRVHRPSVVTLTDLQPARTRSGAGVEVVFSALADKVGTPALTTTAGRLSFGGIGTDLVVDNGLANFGSGAVSKRVSFKPVKLDSAELVDLMLNLQEKQYTPTVTFTSSDGNGVADALAPAGRLVTKDLTVLVDNLAPKLSVSVALPTGQQAVKNGDSITVSGKIDSVDVVPGGNLKVELVPNKGAAVPVTVTTTKLADGTYTFTGSVQPTFTKTADRATSATRFFAKASVADIAGNAGTATTNTVDQFVIDNFEPVLEGPGATTSTTTIAVTFQDVDLGITVGGCDPRQYAINGVVGAVREVRYSTGAPCEVGKPAPTSSGVRILVLRNAMADDATPTVTYSPVSTSLGGDPVRDGAVNEAVRTTIDTIRQIAPLAPEIVRVTRNKGTETATRDDIAGKRTHFTRFPGSATYADNDLVVTFLGSKNGYQIEVLDGEGKRLAVQPVTGPATALDNGEQSVRIPLPAVDGTYARTIRFLAPNALDKEKPLLGDPSSFNVVLDTVAPKVAKRTRTANGVDVTFDDVLHSGTDFASDWFGLLLNSNGTTRAYTAESAGQGDSKDVRTLKVPFPAGTGDNVGVEYRFTSGPDGGQRYLDRAGNSVPNFRVVS